MDFNKFIKTINQKIISEVKKSGNFSIKSFWEYIGKIKIEFEGHEKKQLKVLGAGLLINPKGSTAKLKKLLIYFGFMNKIDIKKLIDFFGVIENDYKSFKEAYSKKYLFPLITSSFLSNSLKKEDKNGIKKIYLKDVCIFKTPHKNDIENLKKQPLNILFLNDSVFFNYFKFKKGTEIININNDYLSFFNLDKKKIKKLFFLFGNDEKILYNYFKGLEVWYEEDLLFFKINEHFVFDLDQKKMEEKINKNIKQIETFSDKLELKIISSYILFGISTFIVYHLLGITISKELFNKLFYLVYLGNLYIDIYVEGIYEKRKSFYSYRILKQEKTRNKEIDTEINKYFDYHELFSIKSKEKKRLFLIKKSHIIKSFLKQIIEVHELKSYYDVDLLVSLNSNYEITTYLKTYKGKKPFFGKKEKSIKDLYYLTSHINRKKVKTKSTLYKNISYSLDSLKELFWLESYKEEIEDHINLVVIKKMIKKQINVIYMNSFISSFFSTKVFNGVYNDDLYSFYIPSIIDKEWIIESFENLGFNWNWKNGTYFLTFNKIIE